MLGAAAGGTLRHADGADAARHGPGKPRHAHVGSREKGCRTAAEAHRTDDPVLPAGPVHRHPWPRRDPGDAEEPPELISPPPRIARSCRWLASPGFDCGRV